MNNSALIRHLDVFSNLDPEDVIKLSKGSAELVVHEGEYVFKMNDPSEALYIIKRGGIAIYRGDDKLAELYDGELFGEMGVLDDKPRGAHAKAIIPSILVTISKETLWSVIDGRMSVEMKIRRKILGRHTANISHTFAKNRK